ncbi:MAG: hypothetical protein ACOYJF_07945 [Prevotella sp.]|jgi:hypothetical protein
MNRYIVFFLPLLMALCLSACSGEDDLQPSGADGNYFLPDEAATDAESVLRRQFYEDNACYLLFNDTLRHEVTGVNTDGTPLYFTELLDLTYQMTSTVSYANRYDYLSTIEEKQATADFIENYLLGHLSESLRPFCWLAVSHITNYSVSDGVYSYNSEPEFYAGDRGVALALGALTDMSETEKQQFAADILASTMANKVSAQTSDVLEPFTSISSSLYGTYVPDEDMAWTEEENLQNMYAAGFVTGHYYDIYLLYNTYPSQDEDVQSYVRLVLTSTEEEVESQFADYPTILRKYSIMRNIILNLGYQF